MKTLRVVFLHCFIIFCPLRAMVNDEPVADNTGYIPSEPVRQDIQKINEDGRELYEYLKKVFKSMRTESNTIRPSDLLNVFLMQPTNINEALNLQYALATDYLKHIVSPHFNALDEAFLAQLHQTQSVPHTWRWFKCHFFEKGLREPLATHKRNLISADMERMGYLRNSTTG